MRSGIFTRLVSRRWRLPVAAALLLGLLPRVFIPAGYMPEAGSPSGLRMCASGFPAALLAFSDAAQVVAHARLMAQMDPGGLAAHMAGMAQHAAGEHSGHGAGHHEGHDASGAQHCVFAALAATALLSAQQNFPAAVSVWRFSLLATTFPGSGQRHFLPQARGPPAVS